MEDLNEFLTQSKAKKKPYTTHKRKDGTQVVVVETSKLTPADEKEVQMLVNSGFILKRKKEGITRTDMERYVQNNYGDQELDKLTDKLDNDNFMVVKKWFLERYVFYPRGIKDKFNNEDKQARYEKAFAEHKKKLEAEGKQKPKEEKTKTDPADPKNENK